MEMALLLETGTQLVRQISLRTRVPGGRVQPLLSQSSDSSVIPGQWARGPVSREARGEGGQKLK